MPPSGPESLQPDMGDAPGAPQADYEVSLRSLSQWELVWRKFRQHRLALFGLGLLTVLVGAALIGPIKAAPTSAVSSPRPKRARRCWRNFRHTSSHWLSDRRETS